MELCVDFRSVAKVSSAVSSSALWGLTRGLLPARECLAGTLEHEEHRDMHTLIS